MARAVRLEVPGGLYHVTARGNAKQPIFLDDGDRRRFLATLRNVKEVMNVLCHDHCLMENHYHLFLETPDANLSRAMRQLNSTYAQSFNRRHARVGHLFQGRYHAKLVEDGPYVLAVSRYIALNPVDAGIGITDPAEWPWSSYRAHAGLSKPPAFLEDDWILSHFHPTDRRAARRNYRLFIQNGIGQPQTLDDRPILGSDSFVASFRELLKPAAPLKPYPRLQRFAARPSLEEIFEGWVGRDDRNTRICKAYLEHGYTMTEIARHLGRHVMTVSRAINAKC